MKCVFCEIVRGSSNAHIISEDKLHMAFLDRYPLSKGHCLIIPKQHYKRITDMKHKNVGELFSIVPHVAKAVLRATKADGFNLGQNNGKAARQIVPHVHIHIIPRYKKIDTIWTKRQMVKDEDLKKLASKIRKKISTNDNNNNNNHK